MDFAALYTEYFVVVVVLACVIVGYLIKHSSWLKFISNDNIPLIVTFVGAILNLFVSGFSINSAGLGAFMGLASTGLHEAFRKFVDKSE